MTTALQNIDLLQKLMTSIGNVALTANKMIDAMEHGNEEKIVAYHAELRLQRSLLGNVQRASSDISAPNSQEGVLLLSHMRDMMNLIRQQEEIIASWKNVELPSNEVLMESSLGRSIFIDRFLPDVWNPEIDLVVIVGEAYSDLLIQQLIKQNQHRILLILPNAEKISDHYPRQVYVATTEEEIRATIQNIRQPVPEYASFATLLDPNLSKEELKDWVRMVNEAIDFMYIQKNTVNSFGKKWVLQGIKNFPKMASIPSIAAIRQEFEGKPMLIIAPGPSLKKNAHLIRALKGKFILVTFSHTFKALVPFGIVPDVVMALDAQDLRYHFDGCPIEEIEMLLLSVTVRPELFSLPAKRVFTFASNSSLDHWLYEPLQENISLTSGGSVAHSAFSLGVYWKCDPIILVGQDLAFSDGKMYVHTSCDGDMTINIDEKNSTYTPGNLSEGMKNLEFAREALSKGQMTQRVLTAPGYYGGTVKTSYSFMLFRRWFEDSAEKLKDICRTWNCTEGGSYIEHMEHLPLAEAIEKLEGSYVDFSKTIDEAIARIHFPTRRERVLKRLEEMTKQIESCSYKAQKCLRLSEKAMKNPRFNKELTEAEQQLSENLKTAHFLSLMMQEKINTAIQEAYIAQTAKETIVSSRKLYNLVLEGDQVLRSRFQDSVKELQTIDSEAKTQGK